MGAGGVLLVACAIAAVLLALGFGLLAGAALKSIKNGDFLPRVNTVPRVLVSIASIAILFGAGFYAGDFWHGKAGEAASSLTAIPVQISGDSLIKLAVTVVLAFIALLFGSLFLSASANGNPPGIDSNWGGFGEALGGWHMSASLAYLIISVSFGVLLFAFTIMAVMPPSLPGGQQNATSAPTPSVAPSAVNQASPGVRGASRSP